MIRHAAAATAVVTAVLLGGCQAAEDAASDVASDAASAASSQVRQAALRQLRDTVCPLVADNALSAGDRDALAAALDLAQGLGVESGLLTAAEDINDSDGTPPASAVAELAEECR